MRLTNEQKMIVDEIVARGHVPEVIEVNPSDWLSWADIMRIEEYAAKNFDRKVRTFVNNIIKENLC